MIVAIGVCWKAFESSIKGNLVFSIMPNEDEMHHAVGIKYTNSQVRYKIVYVAINFSVVLV